MQPKSSLSFVLGWALFAATALGGLALPACARGFQVPRIGSQTGVRTWSSTGERPAEEIRDPSGAPWGP